MKKDAELQLLDDTIEALPPSYLRDILITEKGAIVEAIRNDLGFIDLSSIMRQAVEERAALVETQKKLGEAREDLRKVTSQHTRLSDSINELRSTAKRLAFC